MYQLLDKNGKVIKESTNINELKVELISKYCQEELPRLSQFLAREDLFNMLQIDRCTAIDDGYIEDYAKIEEKME